MQRQADDMMDPQNPDTDPNKISAHAASQDKPPVKEAPDPTETGPAGEVLDEEESEKEFKAMGNVNEDWLTKNKKNTWRMKWGGKLARAYEFKTGNYMSLYRGNTQLGYAPFIAKTDLESDQNWAQVIYNDFYFKKPSVLPWERYKLKILWIPLDKSEDWCENIGGGGIHIKVDQHGRCQVPLKVKLNEEERQKMLKNNRMVGQALLLKSTLQGYEKPKQNWWFWIVIVAVVLVVIIIAMFYVINPHIFDGVIKAFNGIIGAFKPPGASQQ